MIQATVLQITNNQHTIVLPSTHSDFFQGKTDRALPYWANHSGATWLSKQEKVHNSTNTEGRQWTIKLVFS
jgi:hypothetical protein